MSSSKDQASTAAFISFSDIVRLYFLLKCLVLFIEVVFHKSVNKVLDPGDLTALRRRHCGRLQQCKGALCSWYLIGGTQWLAHSKGKLLTIYGGTLLLALSR